MFVVNLILFNFCLGVVCLLSCFVVGYIGCRYCLGGMELVGCCVGLGVGVGLVVVVCFLFCVVGIDGFVFLLVGMGSLVWWWKELS